MIISEWSKDTLIEVTRICCDGKVGDSARNPKQHYVDLLSKMDGDKVAAAYATLAPTAETKATPMGNAAAMAQMIAALQALIPPAGVNRDEVTTLIKEYLESEAEKAPETTEELIARLVAEQIATAEPRVIRHVICNGTVRAVAGVVHPIFDDVIQLAGLRHNILLVGPAGVGKTTLGAMVAEALGLTFSALSCSAGMSESQLGGWLLPVQAGGAFSYVPATFVSAYENGGVFLLDELDAMDGNVGVFINAALANGHFYIPQRHTNPEVKRHADFVCIAAANTFGHGGDMVYAGRERLDGATLDRFRAATLYMGYDLEMETKLVHPDVLAWGLPIRADIERLKLRRVMSTRVMVQFSEQLSSLDWHSDKWERSYFADWSTDELRKIGRV